MWVKRKNIRRRSRTVMRRADSGKKVRASTSEIKYSSRKTLLSLSLRTTYSTTACYYLLKCQSHREKNHKLRHQHSYQNNHQRKNKKHILRLTYQRSRQLSRLHISFLFLSKRDLHFLTDKMLHDF